MLLKKFRIISAFSTLIFLSLFMIKLLNFQLIYHQEPEENFKYFDPFNKPKFVDIENISEIDRNNYKKITDFSKKDWHDFKFIEYERTRKGPGENGKGIELIDEEEILDNKKLLRIEGVSLLVNEKISVNRSLPDTRPYKCREKLYLTKLPKVSIIIIFHNEVLKILYRTIHSIYNRTPRELLHEIILVNDASTKIELYEILREYVSKNFDGLVKVLFLPIRVGLIVARMEGAKIATGEILVFLDAHCEVNLNWLPPLIEPIAIDPLVATTPVLDNLNSRNFQYLGGAEYRGAFDWNFIFKYLEKFKGNAVEEPSENPVMLGFAFAINRQFFWDLGAYDEELLIWNGENYELSFKLWLCGGRLLEVPCSRVGHLFRKHNEYRKMPGVDFVARNFKRIAETWLDEYKEFLYSRNPNRYFKIDPGDLSKPKAIREKLKCKPFKYFLEEVAPDLLKKFPLDQQEDFASGAIYSELFPDLCLDSIDISLFKNIQLRNCYPDKVFPIKPQFWNLTWHRSIKISDTEHCLDVELALYPCHYQMGDAQNWKYDLETHQLILGISNKRCLTINSKSITLSLQKCSRTDPRQKWNWGSKNIKALENWCTYGIEIEDDCE